VLNGLDVTNAAPESLDRAVDGRARLERPDRFEAILSDAHRRQVCLRIEIREHHAVAHLREHESEMVGKRRLTDAALVVEQRDGLHGFRRTVARTWESSTVSSRGGLPFEARRSLAMAMPTPKRSMNPRDFNASAIVGFR
jgi:hypothetical protein